MLRKIPQSDSEMGNLLAKKEQWTWGWHWNRCEPEQHDGNSRYPKWQHIGPALVALAPLLVEECYRAADLEIEGVVPCCMDPVWQRTIADGCIWWCCLLSGQELVWPHGDQGCCALFCAFSSGWTLPHQRRCTHVGQPWHPAQRASTEVKNIYIYITAQNENTAMKLYFLKITIWVQLWNKPSKYHYIYLQLYSVLYHNMFIIFSK